MARIIRTVFVTGNVADGGDWDPISKTEYHDTLNLDARYNTRLGWTAGDVADAALDALQSVECDHEYSHFPRWQPHGWYCARVHVDPDTGYREEKTAHLEGFSEMESRLVHAKLFGGQA